VQKNTFTTVAFIGIAALLTVTAIQMIAPVLEPATAEEWAPQEGTQEELEMSAGETLEVDLEPGGSIHIRGRDEPGAVVRVSFRDTDPEAFRFEFNRTRSGVEITSERLRRVNNVNVRVEVQIPRRSDLQLRTAGGGISIRNIEGTISGRTGGGQLTLENLDGHIELTTGGGEIVLTDSRLDGHVRTGGGRVLLENVEGDIEARSGGGEVVYRNVVTPERTYPADVAYIRNAGGSIRVDDAPGGADVQTGGGDIRIRSAGAYAKARTGGGDIRIDDVGGWIEARTGAGTIEVTMTGAPGDERRDVTLISGLGDIWLTLPAGLSARFDVELGYTRNSSQNFEIRSDFDLVEERTATWDDSQGTPRKYIRGTATIGGGGNLITIRTTNGDVHIAREG